MQYILFTRKLEAEAFGFLAYGCKRKVDVVPMCLGFEAESLKSYESARCAINDCVNGFWNFCIKDPIRFDFDLCIDTPLISSGEICYKVLDQLNTNDSIVVCGDDIFAPAIYYTLKLSGFKGNISLVYHHDGNSAAFILNRRMLDNVREDDEIVTIDTDGLDVAALLNSAVCLDLIIGDTNPRNISYRCGERFRYYDRILDFPHGKPQSVLSNLSMTEEIILGNAGNRLRTFMETRKYSNSYLELIPIKHIKNYLAQAREYITNFGKNNLRLEVDSKVKERIIEQLNKKKRLTISCVPAEHRNAFVSDVINECIFPPSCSAQVVKPTTLVTVYDVSRIFSPLRHLMITEYAFECKCNGLMAQKLRSYCLDVWEIFFRFRRHDLAYKICVKECDIIQLLLSDNDSMYQALIMQKSKFEISHMDDKSVFAVTSPATGFAVNVENCRSVIIGERTFFNQISELNHRASDFQTFIYAYTSIRPFPNPFMNYIKSEISDEAKVRYERSNGFFDLFPEFSDNIPIYE